MVGGERHANEPTLVRRFQQVQHEAQRDGRRLVVGAVVVNPEGEAFLQRRAPDVRLFPGAWDIVGGHVEEGEGLLDALDREIEEETGWRLRSVQRVVTIFDWEGRDGEAKREVDVRAVVDGDLARPRLERDRFTACGWFDVGALAELKARCGDSDEARMIEVALAALS